METILTKAEETGMCKLLITDTTHLRRNRHITKQMQTVKTDTRCMTTNWHEYTCKLLLTDTTPIRVWRPLVNTDWRHTHSMEDCLGNMVTHRGFLVRPY